MALCDCCRTVFEDLPDVGVELRNGTLRSFFLGDEDVGFLGHFLLDV